MPTVQTMFYPTFVAVIAILILLVIPRSDLRRLIPRATVLGGVGDIVTVFIYQDLLGVIGFKNHGIWECANQHFFSPVGWTLVMVLYFYFYPDSPRILRYLYTGAWAALAVGYGLLVRNVELYDFKPWFFPIPMYLVFLGWFAFAIWAYHALSNEDSPELADS